MLIYFEANNKLTSYILDATAAIGLGLSIEDNSYELPNGFSFVIQKTIHMEALGSNQLRIELIGSHYQIGNLRIDLLTPNGRIITIRSVQLARASIRDAILDIVSYSRDQER